MNLSRLAPAISHSKNHRLTASGFSLIELMVTTLIGLIILNGVFQIVIASKRSSIDRQAVIYIQENARFVLDMISRDVRMAGFLGCAEHNIQQVNVINTELWSVIGSSGIVGFDDQAGSAQLPPQYRANVKDKTDALIIQRGDYEHDLLVRSQSPHSHSLELWTPHQFQQGQPLALVDASCRFSALLTASELPTATTMTYRASGHNGASALSGHDTCRDGTGEQCAKQLRSAAYPPGSRIMPLLTHAYYIGESALLPGAPALKRQRLSVVKGALTTHTEELATGIENMQLQYGIDNNGNGQISEYRSAHQMDINDDGIINNLDWQSVRTVKVELLLVSQSPVFSEPQTVQFAGVNYTGLFMRQVVSTTITIRNPYSPS